MASNAMAVIGVAQSILNSVVKGEAWVGKAAVMLRDVVVKLKMVETEKKAAVKKLKTEIKTLEAPFKQDLATLSDIETGLRFRILEEYPGKTPIRFPDGDEIRFRTVWTWKRDVSEDGIPVGEVPAQFLKIVLDEAKITEAVESGVRKISGLKIFQDRTIVVMSKDAIDKMTGEEE